VTGHGRRQLYDSFVQLDLFGPHPTNKDQAALMRRLERAMRGADDQVTGRTLSRAALRRLMTPLPPITVPGWRA
jgi:hypothetical protein